jgi:peptide/nickel transport system permease protein
MSASSVGATDQLATPPAGPAPMVTEIGGGRWGDLWRAISRNRKALAGVLLLLVFVVLAIFPGQIVPDDPAA